MNYSERDLLTIKRDGLLKKKRVLDAIEKLRQIAPKGEVYFKTDCFYLTEASGIHKFSQFQSLLDAIENEGAVYFEINEGSGTLGRWGEDTLKITITDKFDDIYEKVSREYHEINKNLGRDKMTLEKSSTGNKNWMYSGITLNSTKKIWGFN